MMSMRKLNVLESSFQILGFLEILGGAVIAVFLRPQTADAGVFALGGGNLLFDLRLAWLLAGIIFGMLFIAIANGLYYLRTISEHFNPIAQSAAKNLKATTKADSQNSTKDWKCPNCGAENKAKDEICKACPYER
jgi:hypothetical protein